MDQALRRLHQLGNHLTSEEVVLTSKAPPHTGIITLNRPKVFNALNRELMVTINQKLILMERDDSIKVVIITGGPKVFSAGADLNGVLGDKPGNALKYTFSEETNKVLANYKKPIIAVVNGFCLGGGFEICLSADIIVANDKATFGLPEIKLGLMPGSGATQRITRIVGRQKATQLILSGDQFKATEAAKLGVVTHLTTGDAMEFALKLAAKISAYSLPSLILAKNAVWFAYQGSMYAGERREFINFLAAFSLEDKDESIKALLEKRKPEIRDR